MITAALIAAALVLCAFISTPATNESAIAHASGIAVHADGLITYASDEAASPDDPGTCYIRGYQDTYLSFNEALATVDAAQTIFLLSDIRVVSLNLSQGFEFVIELQGHRLTVDSAITITGFTRLIIYEVNGGTLTAGSVLAYDLDADVPYYSHAPIVCDGAEIIIYGGVSVTCSPGEMDFTGVSANGGSFTVYGDVVVSGEGARGVTVNGNATVEIGGDVIAEGYNSYGVFSTSFGYNAVTVGGSVKAIGLDSIGVYSQVGGYVYVTGDVSGDGYGIYIHSNDRIAAVNVGGGVKSAGVGVFAYADAWVTVDGAIDATPKIMVYNEIPDGPDASSEKPGYDQYSNGYSYVWVGNNRIFRVTYNANGGAGAPVDSLTYKTGDAVTVSAVVPSRSNYTFAGWRYNNNTYFGGNIFVIPGNDVTLTAQWTSNVPSGPPGGGGPGGPTNPVNPGTPANPENPGGGEESENTEDAGDSDIPETGASARQSGNTDRSAGRQASANRSAINPSAATKPSDNLPPGTPIFTDDHIRYIIGYPEGDIRPENNITRAEAVTAFYRLLSEEMRYMPASDWKQFSDVELGSWYYMPVSIMIVEEIILGYDDGTFRPDSNISRAELAAIASRFAALMGHGSGGASSFNDIAGHWAEEDIIRLAGFGWSVGYSDGTFKPDQPITRAEFMAIVNRMLKRVPETTDDILDGEMNAWRDNLDPGAWYYLVVQEATNSHTYEYKGVPVPNAGFEYERWIAMM